MHLKRTTIWTQRTRENETILSVTNKVTQFQTFLKKLQNLLISTIFRRNF